MPNVVSFSFEVKDGESAITPCSEMMGNILYIVIHML